MKLLVIIIFRILALPIALLSMIVQVVLGLLMVFAKQMDYWEDLILGDGNAK